MKCEGNLEAARAAVRGCVQRVLLKRENVHENVVDAYARMQRCESKMHIYHHKKKKC